MSTNRWLFTNKQNKRTIRFEGNPSDILNVKWIKVKGRAGAREFKQKNGTRIYKIPSILYDGVVWFGRRIETSVSGAPCSIKCRQATLPYCQCSCKGKNHGIDNPGMDYFNEEDVVYIGV